jgi:hypothetical protein
MNYTKPEITRLSEAAIAICSEDSLTKAYAGFDATSTQAQTNPAYFAEE